jgi:hypothetical protein
LTLQAATQTVSTRPPRVGELVLVRSRRWLVDEVIEAKSPGQTCIARLSCADDDAQGQTLEVLWDYELDRLILEEEGWVDLAAKGFDQPRQFAAFLHTLRWNCVTATDPEIAAAEKINESYVGRVLQPTLLAPDIVEAILIGRQPAEVTLAVLMRPFAVAWTEQRKILIGCLPRSLACLDAVA